MQKFRKQEKYDSKWYDAHFCINANPTTTHTVKLNY